MLRDLNVVHALQRRRQQVGLAAQVGEHLDVGGQAVQACGGAQIQIGGDQQVVEIADALTGSLSHARDVAGVGPGQPKGRFGMSRADRGQPKASRHHKADLGRPHARALACPHLAPNLSSCRWAHNSLKCRISG